jgi:uncharacterized membrane protein YfcA
MTLTVAAAAAVAGALIGLTGIGGVLLVPALTELATVPLERAIAASMMAFLVGGVVAASAHLQHKFLKRGLLVALCAAASVGALAGAASLEFLAAGAVRIFISLLALASGVHALAAPRAASGERIPSSATLGALGLAVGYGSAISGTGGPVILIPILLALGTPARVAIALGLAAQVPIALTATVVNAFAARIDFGLAGMLSALVLAGAVSGSALSRRLSRRRITVAVAITLIGVGLWYGLATLKASI